MNIAICDDEKRWRNTMAESVQKWADERKIAVQLLSFESGSALLAAMNAALDIDVLLLDIEFPDEGDGIAIAKLLRRQSNKLSILFVSGHALKAHEGYMVDAVGFLVKPFEYDRLSFYLDKARKRLKINPYDMRLINIGTSAKSELVPLKDIVFAESSMHDVIVHLDRQKDSAPTIRTTLMAFLEELGRENFVQIHRAFIVSIRRIYGIKNTYPFSVNIKGAEDALHKLSIGRVYLDEVQQAYANLSRERAME